MPNLPVLLQALKHTTTCRVPTVKFSRQLCTPRMDRPGGVIAIPRSDATPNLDLVPVQVNNVDLGISLFLLDGRLVELVRFAPKFGSWLYLGHGNENNKADIERDGKLTMVTEVDPLFIALAVLCQSGRGMFEPAEVLLEPCKNVTQKMSEEQLKLLCEHKTVDDETFFRFDEKRSQRWVDAKISAVAQKVPRKDAVEIVAQYLPDEWAERILATVSEEVKNDTDNTVTDAQQLALDAMQSDVKAEDEAVARNEAEPPRKKKKPAPKKKEVARAARPVTSFFKRK